ncbi:MAG: PLP-dependent aminotransferase family protein [Vicinamibacterales bacterium]
MINYDDFLSHAASGMQESAIRRMGAILAQNRDLISFAPGYPAPDTFPWSEFSEIARELLSGSHPHALQYGATRGFRPLLDAIASIMERRGAATDPSRLLVTTGSQQGLDLVARVLLDPGDVVLVELPAYTGAITAFRNVRAHMEGVPQEQDGIDLGALDATHQRLVKSNRRVRFLYVVPNFQNPTGMLMSLRKRHQLLEWASARNVLIVEDDPYRELYFEDSAAEADVRPIKADDGEGRVLYLSSFSKTLAPGFRVAWVDAPAAIAVKIEMAKQASDLCTGVFDQRIVHECVRRGILERQLPVLRKHYAAKRDVMVEAFRQESGTALTWSDPRGGFFLWATLPNEMDADRLLDRAVRHGVVYVAGSAFFVNDRGGSQIRLSFSAPDHDQIREGVHRLADAIREELREPEQAVRSAPASTGR